MIFLTHCQKYLLMVLIVSSYVVCVKATFFVTSLYNYNSVDLLQCDGNYSSMKRRQKYSFVIQYQLHSKMENTLQAFHVLQLENPPPPPPLQKKVHPQKDCKNDMLHSHCCSILLNHGSLINRMTCTLLHGSQFRTSTL